MKTNTTNYQYPWRLWRYYLLASLGFFGSENLSAQAGSFDASFNSTIGSNATIHSILILDNDKIMIGGKFTSYNGTAINRLARLESNGDLDNSFAVGSGFSGDDDRVFVITRSNQGDYYIGGIFNQYDGIARKNILRINGDGLLDPVYDPGSGTIGLVLDIKNQPDNKVLIAGGFGSYDGNTARGLCRTLANGDFDPTFISLLNTDAVVNSIVVADNAHSYIAGSFGSFDGQLVNKLAKLLPDGGLDDNFEQDNSCNSFIEKILPSGDGNYFLIGNFTEYDGVEVNKVAKINSQGGLIESFDVGEGPDYYLYDAVVQDDGKLILVGDFTTFNGQPASKIVRLMLNGEIDQTFQSGSGADGTILSCSLQSNGKLIISGSFNEYDGNDANGIARILSDFVPTNVESLQPESGLKIFPNPASDYFSIQVNEVTHPLSVRIIDMHGRTIKSVTGVKHIDISDIHNGFYFVETIEAEVAKTAILVIQKN